MDISFISHFLPQGLLDYFTVTDVAELCFVKDKQLHFAIYLEENNNILGDVDVSQYESKGFTEITLQDFPIRGKAVYLVIKRRRWLMGYKLDDNMKTSLVKEALQMAIKNKEHGKIQTIHHSDRGIQYCFPEYTKFARDNGMILSTTEKYDPYENAVAERINETIKYEFGLRKTIPSLEIANKMLKQAVDTYNNQRRHRSLEMQTPSFAHTFQKHQYKSYRKVRKFEETRNVDKSEKIN